MNFIKIFFTIGILNLVVSCSNKNTEWTDNEKSTVVNNFIEMGYAESEITCLVKKISTEMSYEDYSKKGQEILEGKKDESFVSIMRNISRGCELNGYSNEYKKKYTMIANKMMGIPISVAGCIYDQLEKKYSFEELQRNADAALQGNSDLDYITFYNVTKKKCEE